MGADDVVKALGGPVIGAVLAFTASFAAFRSRLALIERNAAVLETEMKSDLTHARELWRLELDQVKNDLNNVATIARGGAMRKNTAPPSPGIADLLAP